MKKILFVTLLLISVVGMRLFAETDYDLLQGFWLDVNLTQPNAKEGMILGVFEEEGKTKARIRVADTDQNGEVISSEDSIVFECSVLLYRGYIDFDVYRVLDNNFKFLKSESFTVTYEYCISKNDGVWFLELYRPDEEFLLVKLEE
jgi:hypothetical protein